MEVSRSLRGLLVSLSLVAATACTGLGPGSMVPLEPPQNWEASLQAARERKDDFFRQAPESPLLEESREAFTGLDYWGPDAGLYFVGPIHVNPRREQFPMVTTAGQTRPCERFGWIEFPVDGMPQKLQVYRLLDMGRGLTTESLLLPFGDGTTGKETYPAGRYLDLEGPEGEILITPGRDGRPVADGPWVLDFNRAYNPSCAYGSPERFACPTTPPENRLRVPIEAGERGYHRAEGAAAGEAGEG